ncbi:hypothetical protein V6Z11_D12G075100, partial [Gossypium hirsutum]
MLKRSVKEGRSLTRSFLVSVTQYLFSWMIDFYFAGVIVFYKLAVVEGMSMRALISYRFIFATARIIPLVFIFERIIQELNLWSTNINIVKYGGQHHTSTKHAAVGDQVLGSLLALASCLAILDIYLFFFFLLILTPFQPPLKRLLTMFLGYHVIKTRTDTHKKKVRNLEERHANLVMDLDQMQWVAWKRLLSFESMGAFLLSAGTKGKRYSLPNPRVMIHQPLGGAEGGQTDIDIQ